MSSSHASPLPPNLSAAFPLDDVPWKEVKKRRGGRGLDLGIRGENFSPGLESSSIDKCLNFPSRKRGKEKFHRFYPRIVNLLFEKWRGLNWSRKVKNLSAGCSRVARVTANSQLKVALLKINEIFFNEIASHAVTSTPLRIDFRGIRRKRIFHSRREDYEEKR